MHRKSPDGNQFSLGDIILLISVMASYLGILSLFLTPEKLLQSLVLFGLFGTLFFLMADGGFDDSCPPRRRFRLRTRLLVGTCGGAIATVAIELFQLI